MLGSGTVTALGSAEHPSLLSMQEVLKSKESPPESRGVEGKMGNNQEKGVIFPWDLLRAVS